MKCRICPNEIHPERLKVSPSALTCSKECSVELRKINNRLGAKRQWERKKARKAADQAMEAQATA